MWMFEYMPVKHMNQYMLQFCYRQQINRSIIRIVTVDMVYFHASFETITEYHCNKVRYFYLLAVSVIIVVQSDKMISSVTVFSVEYTLFKSCVYSALITHQVFREIRNESPLFTFFGKAVND